MGMVVFVLANTEEQMQGYRHFASMARGMDVHFEIIDAEECLRRHPLIIKGQSTWRSLGSA